VFFWGQKVMSVALVHPPHVHQHVSPAAATAAALLALLQPPGAVAGAVGTLDMSTWASHSVIWAELTGGVTSRAGHCVGSMVPAGRAGAPLTGDFAPAW
jgi:hypothetical protein